MNYAQKWKETYFSCPSLIQKTYWIMNTINTFVLWQLGAKEYYQEKEPEKEAKQEVKGYEE